MANRIHTQQPAPVATQSPAPISTRPALADTGAPRQIKVVSVERLKCNGCNAAEDLLQTYATALRGLNRVRYHRCTKCGRTFKTIALIGK